MEPCDECGRTLKDGEIYFTDEGLFLCADCAFLAPLHNFLNAGQEDEEEPCQK